MAIHEYVGSRADYSRDKLAYQYWKGTAQAGKYGNSLNLLGLAHALQWCKWRTTPVVLNLLYQLLRVAISASHRHRGKLPRIFPAGRELRTPFTFPHLLENKQPLWVHALAKWCNEMQLPSLQVPVFSLCCPERRIWAKMQNWLPALRQLLALLVACPSWESPTATPKRWCHSNLRHCEWGLAPLIRTWRELLRAKSAQLLDECKRLKKNIERHPVSFSRSSFHHLGHHPGIKAHQSIRPHILSKKWILQLKSMSCVPLKNANFQQTL